MPVNREVRPFERDWVGCTAVYVGNGISTEALDLSVLKRPHVRVITTNGWDRFPEADVVMCSDRHWLAANSRDWSGFKGKEIVTTQPQAVVTWDPRIRVVRRAFIEKVRPGQWFSNPNVLIEGHTSTTTCISMAVLRGAGSIVLLGVDLRPSDSMKRRAGDNTRDKENWRARYAKHVKWITMQSEPILKRGIEVFNCSPRSPLECYPYAKLEDVL